MSRKDYITLLALPISELNNPAHRARLDEFAGELAAPCVAEALMALLRRAK
jgi:hypothetical protein